MAALPHRTPRLAMALLIAVIGGCAATTSTPTPTPTPSPSATLVPTPAASHLPSPTTSSAPSPSAPSPSASPAPSPSPSAAVTCASQTLASMTLGQEVGQLFMIGLTDDRLDAAERDAVAQSHFGSMVFTKKTSIGVAGVRAIADAVQAQATQSATAGVGFFVAANQEGGQIQTLSGRGFGPIPTALGQGALPTAELRDKATVWGRQLGAAGINLDLAPVADVVPPGTDARNAPIGQLQREYGHDPATVSSHVAAFVEGMQAAGIDTTAKHFPGLGRVVGNTDDTSDVIDTVTTRQDPYLEPFASAIDAGVPFVMVSLATYERIDPQHLAVFSPTVIDGILRHDLGFDGIVISDALGATAVATIAPATRAIDFLDAGGDMIIVNQLPPAIEMARALASQATDSASFRARVDDAALRILEAKDAVGLLTCAG